MLHWAVEVVDHKQQDWLNLLLGVASIVGESGVLYINLVCIIYVTRVIGPTHSPLPRTRRARNMAAAETWLGGYSRNR